MWSCIFIFAFSLLCDITYCIVLFTLGETFSQRKVLTRISNHSTCEWDCLSLMIFHPVCHFPHSSLTVYVSFSMPFLSRLLSYCLSSKHSWLIWPWGSGLPASLRVSPSLSQLKPAGRSALGVIAYESSALPKTKSAFTLHTCLPAHKREEEVE